MRTPTPYRNKDGTTSWKVRYRYDGRQTSFTFYGGTDKTPPPEAVQFAEDLDKLKDVAEAVRRREARSARARTRQDNQMAELRSAIEQLTEAVKAQPTAEEIARAVAGWPTRCATSSAKPDSASTVTM